MHAQVRGYSAKAKLGKPLAVRTHVESHQCAKLCSWTFAFKILAFATHGTHGYGRGRCLNIFVFLSVALLASSTHGTTASVTHSLSLSHTHTYGSHTAHTTTGALFTSTCISRVSLCAREKHVYAHSVPTNESETLPSSSSVIDCMLFSQFNRSCTCNFRSDAHSDLSPRAQACGSVCCGSADRQTDRQTDRRTDGQTDRH